MTHFSFSRFLQLVAALGVAALFAPAQADPPDFRPLLDDAIHKGLPRVVIPPGTYRLTGISINGAKNLTIIADGVTLLGPKLTRALNITNCANVTLRGLIVDYDPLPFTQGKVTAIAPDLSSIDVTLDAGYPRQPYDRIDICDPATRYRKRGMPFLWGTRAEMVGDDVVRVHLSGIGKVAKIGDLASMSTGSAPGCPPHAISIENCSGMVFDHVTVYTAPGMGILESGGAGAMKYTHCRVVPGPKPPGATEARLLSTTWDAMQSKVQRHGPDVEDCEIRDAGDDSWSVQSSDYVVMAIDGPKVVLAFRDIYCDGPGVGDRLQSSLDAPVVTIVTRKETDLSHVTLSDDIRGKIGGQPWDYWRVGPRALEITTKEPFPYKVGDSLYCPDEQCNHFTFRHNKVHSSGRILVKASDGLIEDNDIDQCHSGVTVCAEVPAESAVGIENITIRDNRIAGTGYFCELWNSSQSGSVSVTAESPGHRMHPPGAFRNIVIEGNRFDDIKGPSIVVSSTQKLTISKNTFTKVMTAPPPSTGGQVGIDTKALIWLDQCDDITVKSNRVQSPGQFLKDLIAGRGLAPGVLEMARAGIQLE